MGLAQFERSVVYHCAPALVGLRPACLISLPAAEYPALPRLAAAYSRQLARRGVRMEVLCRCRRRFLLLVYRPALLERCLSSPQVAGLLAEAGYPAGASPAALLRRLSGRIAAGGGFPHELGLFLGYPPEDVVGFMTHGGSGCRLCGEWKVYQDVEGARQQFRKFALCRSALCARLERGCSLLSLLGAAKRPAA